MLTQAITFLVLAAVAGGLGIVRVSGGSSVTTVARVQSVLFLVLAAVMGLLALTHAP